MSDNTPLLPGANPNPMGRRKILTTILVPVLLLAGVIFISIRGDGVPKEPLDRAKYWLKNSPVIDGHIDVPIFVREVYGNDITSFDLNKVPGHFDIPRAREGRLGGFFWSIFTECQEKLEGPDFVNATDGARDALEQIDVATNLINRYSNDFALCRTADEVEAAVRAGKIASLFGLEGAHSLGNSLGTLRMLHQLGVRYMTLTHSCNNAFADSGGIFERPVARWGGLSPLGKELIKEMNRLGVLVDLSHVSDKTALDALAITRAPVMWSHSCTRSLNNISRNVPDYVIDKIGRGKGKVDGVIMVNFFPKFAAPEADGEDVGVKIIADHVEHFANRIGRHHVGIGSDYDGIESTPKGLEDVSKYPNLFAELINRGWGERDLALLAGGNILRVMRGMEAVSAEMRDEPPSMARYSERHDLDPKGYPPF